MRGLLADPAGAGGNPVMTHKTMNTVQALRAIAAAGVLAYHVVYVMGHRAGYSLNDSSLGESGVDLFFVISGFIMIYTTAGSFNEPNASLAFMRRRIIRIVPLYWLCTTGIVLLLAFFPRLFTAVAFDWQSVISSYLFLLARNSAGKVGTVMQTGWTLCYEFYFYLVFAVLLLWPRKFFWVASAAIFAGGVALGSFAGDLPPWSSAATSPLLSEFYAGAVIGLLFIKNVTVPRWLLPIAVLVAIVAAGTTKSQELAGWTRVVWWGIPGAAILIGAVSLERTGVTVPKVLVALGNSSYSLYLTHPFVLPVFGKLGLALHASERVPAVVFGLIAFVTSLLVGHAVYRLVEMPMTRYFSKAWASPASRTY
jgi:exopolysaccharide production protein ExoZ